MIEDISKYKDLIVELYKLQANTFVLYLLISSIIINLLIVNC